MRHSERAAGVRTGGGEGCAHAETRGGGAGSSGEAEQNGARFAQWPGVRVTASHAYPPGAFWTCVGRGKGGGGNVEGAQQLCKKKGGGNKKDKRGQASFVTLFEQSKNGGLDHKSEGTYTHSIA